MSGTWIDSDVEMKVWRIFKELYGDILIVILAGDIIYLYFAGFWHEPITIIRIAELIWLPLCIVLGVELLVRDIRGYMRRTRKGKQ